MSRDQIQALLRIKHVIHQLRALDSTTLTPAKHEAWREMLAQAYDRAAYFLQEEIDKSINTREQTSTLAFKSHEDHRSNDKTAYKEQDILDKRLVYHGVSGTYVVEI